MHMNGWIDVSLSIISEGEGARACGKKRRSIVCDAYGFDGTRLSYLVSTDPIGWPKKLAGRLLSDATECKEWPCKRLWYRKVQMAYEPKLGLA